MRWIDSFSRKHPRFGIPNLFFYLIIARGIVYMVDMISFPLSSYLALIPDLTFGEFQIWRLVTFLFVPGEFISSGRDFFFAALALYFFYFVGQVLERNWGTGKFTLYYLIGVGFSIVTALIFFFTGNGYAFISSTFLDLSLFLALATLVPDMRLYVLFIIPVKIKWLGLISGVIFLLSFFSALFNGQFLQAIIILLPMVNYLMFFGSDLRYLLKRNYKRNKHHTSATTVNFKAAQREAKKEKGYLHKCTVCGETDGTAPQMEFRYCSKCNGYHCYCSEHINDHIHVE
jgi:Predicted membrane protein